MKSIRRQGFTLIELLVVIAIIGVLIALLLPAIQAARESARRAQCSSNLHNLAIALQGYLDATGQFPIHGRYGQSGSGPKSGGWGHLAFLLPHLEQQAVFDNMNFSVPSLDYDDWYLPTNINQTVALRGNAIPSFLCPSDPSDSLQTGAGTQHNYGMNGGYCVRADNAPDYGAYVAWRPNGVLNIADGWAGYQLKGGLRRNAIIDGESKTCGFSEFVKGRGYNRPNDVSVWYSGPNIDVAWNTGGTPAGAKKYLDDQVDGCRAMAAAGSGMWPNKGELPFMGEGGRGYIIGFGGPPNFYSCGYFPADVTWIGFHFAMTSAQSSHPGGVNVALLDGTVNFVGDSVDIGAWRALGTRAGRETATAF